MDVLPHNTSASLPDPCVRSDALCTSSVEAIPYQAVGEAAFTPSAPADFSPTDLSLADFSLVDFSLAVNQAIDFVTTIFKSEIKQKRLYYHGLEHVNAVARRSLLIFDTVVPFFHSDEGGACDVVFDWQRQRELLRLSAIAHDMIQLFVPQAEVHSPRQRESGLSELKTFEHLYDFMLGCVDNDHSPLFTAADIALVRCAIAATVCKIDPADGGIYQPLLYAQSVSPSVLFPLESSQLDVSSRDVLPSDAFPLDAFPLDAFPLDAFPLDAFPSDAFTSGACQGGLSPSAFFQLPPSLSLVPRCLALADIGTLGIDGVAAYQKEGSLLLLEENLDIVDFVTGARTLDAAAQDVLRQRLLKRARFQLVFAKSRLARLDSELFGLPEEAISALKQSVFKHLTTESIAAIERVTPTAENVSLRALLAFFQLESCLKEIS